MGPSRNTHVKQATKLSFASLRENLKILPLVHGYEKGEVRARMQQRLEELSKLQLEALADRDTELFDEIGQKHFYYSSQLDYHNF